MNVTKTKAIDAFKQTCKNLTHICVLKHNCNKCSRLLEFKRQLNIK